MTDERLDELERLAAAATPGPWSANLTDVDAPNDRLVCTTDNPYRDNPRWPADVAFIAAARSAVPELVAEVRRLRALLAAASSG